MTLCVDEKLVLIELVGAKFLLGRLTGHGEEERKRHDLAFENLQRVRDEWNKRKAQKAEIKKELMSHCLEPIKVVGLVRVSKRKKRDRKIVEVADDCWRQIIVFLII